MVVIRSISLSFIPILIPLFVYATTINSIQMNQQTFCLTKNATESFSFCTNAKNLTKPISGKLPINEMYGTGQSSISLSKKEDSLFCNYEWNSGSSGGFYHANLTHGDSLLFTNYITASFDNEMENYKETINFIKRLFTRKTGKFSNNGPLLVATDNKITKVPRRVLEIIK